MELPLNYIASDDFRLRWRFYEDANKYTLLPEEDRRHFKPLSEESSQTSGMVGRGYSFRVWRTTKW